MGGERVSDPIRLGVELGVGRGADDSPATVHGANRDSFGEPPRRALEELVDVLGSPLVLGCGGGRGRIGTTKDGPRPIASLVRGHRSDVRQLRPVRLARHLEVYVGDVIEGRGNRVDRQFPQQCRFPHALQERLNRREGPTVEGHAAAIVVDVHVHESDELAVLLGGDRPPDLRDDEGDVRLHRPQFDPVSPNLDLPINPAVVENLARVRVEAAEIAGSVDPPVLGMDRERPFRCPRVVAISPGEGDAPRAELPPCPRGDIVEVVVEDHHLHVGEGHPNGDGPSRLARRPGEDDAALGGPVAVHHRPAARPPRLQHVL
mmetsp:Transcript_3918/g.10802  ORF Transcript_3918/g.10802 Transcript_3918/m.10802 type:complete len:318 (+) Transcript_3918:4413-5366(+)